MCNLFGVKKINHHKAGFIETVIHIHELVLLIENVLLAKKKMGVASWLKVERYHVIENRTPGHRCLDPWVQTR